MTTHANAQRLRETYDAFGRGDLRPLLDLLSDDITWIDSTGTTDGEQVSWTGVHVWSFDGDRCDRFVNYGSAEYQRFWAGKH